MNTRRGLPALAILLAAIPGWGRTRLETAIEPAETQIGRPFQVRITVVADPRDTLLPLAPTVPPPFELIAVSSSPVSRQGSEQRQEWVVSLRLFDVGVSTLPALSVQTRSPAGVVKSIATPDIPVAVKSVLTEKDREFHGMKGGLNKVLDGRRLAILLGGLGLAGLMGFYWRWKKPAKPAPVGPPPPPAHVAALDALSRLEGDSALTDKAYYSRLTEILRCYLEGRYAVPAMDQTTAETLAAVKALPISTETRFSIREVLDHSDLAKFAKGVLTPRERAEDLGRVRAFVDVTRPTTGTGTRP